MLALGSKSETFNYWLLEKKNTDFSKNEIVYFPIICVAYPSSFNVCGKNVRLRGAHDGAHGTMTKFWKKQ